ncbi:MAG: LysR family transcriptional regulator [Silvibacterium sp.]|nr:LysR family transcriptional regulator [Silvibacterium sp.]
MDIKQLRYFVGVIQAGSISKAADTLRIAQPALGLHIRRLEEELSVPLMTRHSRGVEPTEAGQILFDSAVRILADVDATSRALREFTGPPRGKVTLGLTPSLNAALAASVIRRCSAEIPLVSITMVEELSGVLAEWIAAGRLDIALAYNVPEGRALINEPLLSEELFWVTPIGDDVDYPAEVPFSTLATHPLIMPGLRHTMRRLLEDAAAKEGITLDVVFEMQSVSTVKELVEEGIGATVLPLGAVRHEVDRGILRAQRIVSPTISRVVHLLRPSVHAPSKAESEIVRIILDLARSVQESAAWTVLSPQ